MRRYSLAVRRLVLALTCTVLASLAVVASAQAVVVNDGGTEAGVALVPNVRQVGSTTTGCLRCGDLAPSRRRDVPDRQPRPSLTFRRGTWPLSGDPYSAQPICWQGGPVMHANETFTLDVGGAVAQQLLVDDLELCPAVPPRRGRRQRTLGQPVL